MIDDMISRPIFNYIGAIIRFLLGTTVRKIFGLKTYTFSECLNGPIPDALVARHRSPRQPAAGRWLALHPEGLARFACAVCRRPWRWAR